MDYVHKTPSLMPQKISSEKIGIGVITEIIKKGTPVRMVVETQHNKEMPADMSAGRQYELKYYESTDTVRFTDDVGDYRDVCVHQIAKLTECGYQVSYVIPGNFKLDVEALHSGLVEGKTQELLAAIKDPRRGQALTVGDKVTVSQTTRFRRPPEGVVAYVSHVHDEVTVGDQCLSYDCYIAWVDEDSLTTQQVRHHSNSLVKLDD